MCERIGLCCLHYLRLLFYNFFLLLRFRLFDLSCVNYSLGLNFRGLQFICSFLFDKAHLFFFKKPFLKAVPEFLITSLTATFNHTFHHSVLVPFDSKCKSQNATLSFWFTCDIPIFFKSECFTVWDSRVPHQYFHSDCLRGSFEQFHIFRRWRDLDKGVVFYLKVYIQLTCFKHLLVHINLLVIRWICPWRGRDFFLLFYF